MTIYLDPIRTTSLTDEGDELAVWQPGHVMTRETYARVVGQDRSELPEQGTDCPA
ncbi:hypothetical protein [Pseudoduganella sp. R-34]|uniref:hypothetical protein n=1 Tax=unclassified Pseudoduganella TaxID=2637179 RepID=UPI003CFA20C1